MRLWLCLAAACFLLVAGSADARPYTVDDLLRTEELGQVAFDPTGRWLLIERRGPYETAPRFDYADSNRYQLGRLLILDTAGRAGPAPLLPAEPATGYVAGPFSPDGAFVVVFRLRDRHWEAGIASTARRSVRWLALTPEFTLHGRAAQWRSARDLVLLTRPDASLPSKLREGWQPSQAAARRGAAAALGGVSAAVHGSGAFRARAAAPDPRTLVRIDAASGAVTRLATGPFEDMEVSPTGRYAAVTVIEGDRAPLAGETFRGAGALVRHGLRIIDLRDGRARSPCPGADIGVLLLSWSRTTDHLLVLGRRGAGWSPPGLIRVAAASGRALPLGVQGLAPVTSLAWGVPTVSAGWLDDDAVVLARPAGSDGRADWWRLAATGAVNLTAGLATAPGRPVAVDGRGLVFIEGGKTVSVDRHGRTTAIAGTAAPRSGAILGAGLRPALALPAPGAPVPAVATGGEILAASSGGAVVTTRGPSGETRVHLLRRDGAAILLTGLNAHLAGVGLATVVALPHDGAGGAPLKSWLYLPPGAQDAGPLPLVILPYAGAVYSAAPSQMDGDRLALTPNAQVLAGRGYAVLVPSLPRDPSTGEPAAGLVAQVEAILDRAIATGRVDPDRIAVWGHSFGGYTALVLATQPGRVRSVIASAGISDLAEAWARFSPQQAATPEPGQTLVGAGWAENGQAGLAVPPWRDPDRYVRNSPLYRADRVRVPVLLFHGDQDTLPVGQAEAMFSALQRQDKDAMLVVYASEGHVISSPGNLRDMYARVFDWLEITLARR